MMSFWFVVGLVPVTRENKAYFQPGSFLSKQVVIYFFNSLKIPYKLFESVHPYDLLYWVFGLSMGYMFKMQGKN